MANTRRATRKDEVKEAKSNVKSYVSNKNKELEAIQKEIKEAKFGSSKEAIAGTLQLLYKTIETIKEKD